METVEVIIYFLVAVIVGGLMIAVIVNWNADRTYDGFKGVFTKEPQVHYEEVSNNSFAQTVMNFWESSGLGSKTANKTVLITDEGHYNKEVLVKTIKRYNYCKTLAAESLGCGTGEDIVFTDDIDTPAVVNLDVDADSGRLIVNAVIFCSGPGECVDYDETDCHSPDCVSGRCVQKEIDKVSGGCANGRGKCNAASECEITCDPNTCPDTDNDCMMPTCVEGDCNDAITQPRKFGFSCSATAGGDVVGACDGSGHCNCVESLCRKNGPTSDECYYTGCVEISAGVLECQENAKPMTDNTPCENDWKTCQGGVCQCADFLCEGMYTLEANEYDCKLMECSGPNSCTETKNQNPDQSCGSDLTSDGELEIWGKCGDDGTGVGNGVCECDATMCNYPTLPAQECKQYECVGNVCQIGGDINFGAHDNMERCHKCTGCTAYGYPLNECFCRADGMCAAANSCRNEP